MPAAELEALEEDSLDDVVEDALVATAVVLAGVIEVADDELGVGVAEEVCE